MSETAGRYSCTGSPRGGFGLVEWTGLRGKARMRMHTPVRVRRDELRAPRSQPGWICHRARVAFLFRNVRFPPPVLRSTRPKRTTAGTSISAGLDLPRRASHPPSPIRNVRFPAQYSSVLDPKDDREHMDLGWAGSATTCIAFHC